MVNVNGQWCYLSCACYHGWYVLSLRSHQGCSSYLACPNSPVLVVLKWMSCIFRLFPFVLDPNYSRLPLSYPGCPVLIVPSRPLDLSLLFCPDCPLQATASCFKLSYLSCPVSVVLSPLSCLCCHILTPYFCPGYPVLNVLSWPSFPVSPAKFLLCKNY